MSDSEKADCMLEKIVDFLIKAGEHCMGCEGKK